MALILTLMAPAYASSANETSIDWFMKGYNLYNQEKLVSLLMPIIGLLSWIQGILKPGITEE